MAGRVWGLLCGGLVAWGVLAVAGAVHRYCFGPTMARFGDPDLFMSMSTGSLLALVALRGFAALLGAGVASGISGWRHAAWVGPAVVTACMFTTLLVVGMAQPLWTLVASLVVVVLAGLLIGRAPRRLRAEAA